MLVIKKIKLKWTSNYCTVCDLYLFVVFPLLSKKDGNKYENRGKSERAILSTCCFLLSQYNEAKKLSFMYSFSFHGGDKSKSKNVFSNITSYYRQIWPGSYPVTFVVPNIVEILMNKIAL